MSWLTSKRSGPIFGAVLLLLIMAPAVVGFGSGSQNPLDNANRGWTTANFWDKANDNTSTYIKFRAACDDNYAGTSNANETARWQLLRFAGFFPWEDRGTQTHVCGNAANVVWNEGIEPGPAEWYKWHLINFSGSGNTLDVPSDGVYWQY